MHRSPFFFTCGIAALMAACLGPPVSAEPINYDATKVFTINAPVETLSWTDPHTHITLKYQGDTWEATLAPLFRMSARGLSQDMLKPGTMVAVEGYPSTQKAHEMRAERIIVAGKTVELR